MPLATRTDLEDMIGQKNVTELLRYGADGLTGQELAEHEERRLGAALNAGDALIAQFLPVPEPDDEDVEALHEIAKSEALYWLQHHTEGGASESADVAMQQRRRDLGHMRERKQNSKRRKKGSRRRNRVVESAGRYRSDSKIY